MIGYDWCTGTKAYSSGSFRRYQRGGGHSCYFLLLFLSVHTSSEWKVLQTDAFALRGALVSLVECGNDWLALRLQTSIEGDGGLIVILQLIPCLLEKHSVCVWIAINAFTRVLYWDWIALSHDGIYLAMQMTICNQGACASHLLGMPLPLPRSARCAAPGGRPRCGACGCSDCSFSTRLISNRPPSQPVTNHKEEWHTDSLIHTQNQTTRLHRRHHRIYLHQTRLPHKGCHIIPHALVVKVHTRPQISLAMFDTQLG